MLILKEIKSNFEFDIDNANILICESLLSWKNYLRV